MAHLSFSMQKQQCLIIDIVGSVNEGKEKIVQLQSSECKLLFPSVSNKNSNVKIDAAATNLPSKPNHQKPKSTFWKTKRPFQMHNNSQGEHNWVIPHQWATAMSPILSDFDQI